jgi:hypothetical protein
MRIQEKKRYDNIKKPKRVLNVIQTEYMKEISSEKTSMANFLSISGNENYMYLGDYNGGFKIIDITDKTDPKILSSVPIPYALQVAVNK